MRNPRTIKQMVADPRPIAGGDGRDDTRQKVREMYRDDMRAVFSEALSGSRQARPAIYGDPGDGNEPSSPTLALRESAAFKGWMDRFPDGGPKSEGDYSTDPVAIPGGLRSVFAAASGAFAGRALITGASDSAGPLSPTQHLGLLEPGRVRPLKIRDLVNIVPVDQRLIEYVKELSRASNAAPVTDPEQIAHSGDETATKPEGGLVFQTVETRAKTFAEWVAAHVNALSDASQLQQYIEAYLLYDLALEIEDQIVSGDGTGENFLGVMNAGINVLSPPTTDDEPLEQVRKAKTVVELQGRTDPTAVAFHPTDFEFIELLKVNSETNNFVRDPFTGQIVSVWGMPPVVTDAVPLGEAVVGDWSKATLFDRDQATVRLGTVGDDFIRNIVRLLAEARAGFGVIRPSAFARCPLYSGGASSA